MVTFWSFVNRKCLTPVSQKDFLNYNCQEQLSVVSRDSYTKKDKFIFLRTLSGHPIMKCVSVGLVYKSMFISTVFSEVHGELWYVYKSVDDFPSLLLIFHTSFLRTSPLFPLVKRFCFFKIRSKSILMISTKLNLPLFDTFNGRKKMKWTSRKPFEKRLGPNLFKIRILTLNKTGRTGWSTLDIKLLKSSFLWNGPTTQVLSLFRNFHPYSVTTTDYRY